MNIANLPLDLKAEALLSHYPQASRTVDLRGAHKRNAYKDIASISLEDNGNTHFSIAKSGLYDILPECLFHPVDRFENLPANEYKERFKEEYEQQQLEENNARNFFKPFDRFVIELSSIVAQLKNSLSDDSVIADMIGDNLSVEYSSNRFVSRTRQFLPICRQVRGNRTFLTFLLRKVLFEEGLGLAVKHVKAVLTDDTPQYNYRVETLNTDEEAVFLGNEFEEEVTVFTIPYWKEEECNARFLDFIGEMEVYERFINDYFVGIEQSVRFDITNVCAPVRLSDEFCYNYLDYNTNI